MKIDLEEEDIKKILNSYFNKQNSDCNDVRIKALETDYDCELTFSIYSKINLLGQDYKTTIELTEEEVKDIFTNILYDDGYEVRNILFHKGISNNCAYFDGITISMEKLKNKTKSIGSK